MSILDTVKADAMRRDLTINSLFYNLSTRQVEDFTGKGISDLVTNTIRTPINPLQTFKDDPLRIFRVIRFSAKYNGNIDPETYAAMTDPSLKAEIKQKISKERIGAEIKKMLKNPNASKAITVLKETGLLSDILEESIRGTKYEGKMSPLDMEQDNPNHTLNFWGHTMQVVTHVLDKYKDADEEKRIALILAALFHDLGKLFSEIQKKKEGTNKYPGHEKGYTTYVGHEEESAEIVEHILKYLKLDPYVQQVAGMAKYHMQPHSLIRDDDAGEKALGKFIRRMGELSLNWLDVFNLSVADAYSKDAQIDEKVVSNYKALETRLQQALVSLSPKPDNKIEPILNGTEIMEILGVKPGPHMKEMTEFVRELKDENPSITKEEAIQKIKDRFSTNHPPVEQEQPLQDKSIKEAATDKKKTSTCPKQLLYSKSEEIHCLIDSNKLYEANSIMKQLQEEYGKSEEISRLISINTLKILIKNQTLRDNNLLQYLFDYAKENFFDYILGAYVLGIILLIDTDTKDNVIMEVASRTMKLSPGTLQSVIDILPQNKIFNLNCYKQIRKMLQNEDIKKI